MFDIGFSELLVIAVVALIVIGPERLPRVARTVGLLTGRMRRYVGDIKADINREIQLEELKRLQQEVHDRVMAADSAVRREVHAVTEDVAQDVRSSVANITGSLNSAATGASDPATPAPVLEKTSLDGHPSQTSLPLAMPTDQPERR
jgi:sec-independent protein translocase protein TatB